METEDTANNIKYIKSDADIKSGADMKIDSDINSDTDMNIDADDEYRLSAELISSISHGIGTGLAIAGCVLCIVKAAHTGGAASVVAASIFGACMILMYLSSTLYHALKPCKGRQVFRVLNRCAAFLLLGGTYMPFALVSLKGQGGWIFFGIVWGLAILCIIANAINTDRFETVSVIVYLLMGWAIVFKLHSLEGIIGPVPLAFLVIGGAAYTAGAILYLAGGHRSFVHALWHFFVLAGSICHFFAIYLGVFR